MLPHIEAYHAARAMLPFLITLHAEVAMPVQQRIEHVGFPASCSFVWCAFSIAYAARLVMMRVALR
jgi:hypothetical protein